MAAAAASNKRQGGNDEEDSTWGSSTDEDNDEEEKKKALVAQKLKTLWGDADKDKDQQKESVTGDEGSNSNSRLKKVEAKVEEISGNVPETVGAGFAAAVREFKEDGQETSQNMEKVKRTTIKDVVSSTAEIKGRSPSVEVAEDVVDWSSSSEDLDDKPEPTEAENVISQEEQNKDVKNATPVASISISEERTDSLNVQPSESVLPKSHNSQSWTGPIATVFKENDLSSLGGTHLTHSRTTSEGNIVSSNRKMSDVVNQAQVNNIPLLKKNSESSLYVSNSSMGDVENEVRLARVTSSEILGEMELELEINPFAKKGSQANSGQGDFVDPFKVKNEPVQPISGRSSMNRKNEPIPYSKLLGRKIPHSRSTQEYNIPNDNDTNANSTNRSEIPTRLKAAEDKSNDIAGSCSNSEFSVEVPVPSFKKPLLSRIKRKISKTFSRSNSSLQVTKSLPTLNEESQPNSAVKPNEIPSKPEATATDTMSLDDEGEGDDDKSVLVDYNLDTPSNQPSREEISHISEVIDLELQSLKLLKEAKAIVEKVLSPEDKRDVEQRVQAFASKTSLFDLLLDENLDLSDSESHAGAAASKILSSPMKS